jgi:hypothetical protein
VRFYSNRASGGAGYHGTAGRHQLAGHEGDDIALARAKAISERTIVHIVFVPPEITSLPFTFAPGRDQKLGERLKSGQLSSYALFAERTVGDQPGHPRFRYLTQWKTLSDGIFIAPDKFNPDKKLWDNAPDITRPFEYVSLPFPSSFGIAHDVPHVAFDPEGRLLIYKSSGAGPVRVFEDEVIPLVRGSALYSRDANGNLADFDFRQARDSDTLINYNRIRIDGVTGRGRIETPPIQ